MFSPKTSVVVVVITALVALTTLVLGILGVIEYQSARNRELEKVRAGLALDANQIVPALELPMWNFDHPVIEQVVEGMMLDPILSGIELKSADRKTTICARERDAQGKVNGMKADFPATRFLIEKREIVFGNETLGTVRLFATTKSVEVRMKEMLVWIVFNILTLDLILILGIYLLLHRCVFRPLREVEAYAAGVSSGQPASPGEPLRGELENLRVSIGKMLGELEARHAQLQSEITERKQAEENIRMLNADLERRVEERTADLRDSEENLAVTLRSIGDGVLATDAEGRVTHLNAVAEILTGWSEAEAKGRPVGDVFRIVHDETREPANLRMNEFPVTGAIHGLGDHAALVARDGREFSITDSVAPIRNVTGGTIGAVLVFRDVTAERGAERRQRQHHEQVTVFQRTLLTLRDHEGDELADYFKLATAALAEALGVERVGIWLFDEPRAAIVCEYLFTRQGEGDVQHTRGARLTATGFPRYFDAATEHEVIVADDACAHPATHEFTDSYFKPLGISSTLDVPILREGILAGVICHEHTGPVRKWTQEEVKFTTQATNYVTLALEQAKRRRAETALTERTRELSVANARLEQASRHKDEFLANMSHELRTPLNAILGLSEALLEQVAETLSARQVKALTMISTSGQHLLALINDILDLSKVEAGKVEIHAEPLNAEEFCQSCLAFVRTQATHKQVEVAFDSDGRVTNFYADPRRFKQVLVNLLTNAVKFTPEGGRIGLSVGVMEGGEGVRFTVWDTGIGIAPEDAATLFRAFTQIDSGLNRSQEGTGLGLALVAKLVELHGGCVELESGPGQGSRFIVTLPMGTPEGMTEEDATTPGPRTFAAGPPILLAENHGPNVRTIGGYLEHEGYAMHYAGNGVAAVKLARELRPSLVLMDIQMPVMDGLTAMREIRADAALKQIPIIALTSLTVPGDRERCLAAGADDYLSKPVSLQKLARRIRQTLHV